jgi:hypothetical protein
LDEANVTLPLNVDGVVILQPPVLMSRADETDALMLGEQPSLGLMLSSASAHLLSAASLRSRPPQPSVAH